ncbi:hypothetical protein NLX67_22065 [Domibacillus sp. A3M-37]|nr:hypothetical protein [Domibacillus sp. A3M-37]
MPFQDIYRLCCKHYGKPVRITCHDGRVYTGKITRVTRDHVWIRPAQGLGGFGYGFYGAGGYGFYGGGYGARVALAAVGGFALGAAAFW